MTERDIFLEALEMTKPEARAAYLQGACGGDVTLRRKVEELLKEHFSDDSLLAGSAVEGERPGIAEVPVKEAPAQMIGRYKLLEKLGEGGFGEVWMAEQREPVKRRVALKIIKPGMDSRQVVARFEAERQALAMMDHANIAKIFDAGTTESGRPYFVMELVRGIKITEYCDQKQLPTEERLKLFILVCQAIQHAHQKGIIHRDIKPSNILVTLHDGVPVPKVIDFGIAKATQGELTDKTLFTQFQQFIGTPAYISPEQAEMSGLDIDTRADTYSLGVLLYELLVGQTPFDGKEMMQGGLDALRQIIREKEPLRPSTKLNTLQGDARTTAGKLRQTEVGRLVHQLQGDLDWIVMKCLEKERGRRYETANGLAADLQRHLNNEPVTARPPSRLYEFQKSVRRHKVGFAAATAIILALAIGLGISIWTLRKEKQALARAVSAERDQAQLRQQAETARTKAEANERKAETAAATSAQVAQFMKDMLQGVGPSVAMGRDTALLKEILDKTADRIGVDLKNQPQVEAEIRSTLGTTYIALGEFRAAVAMAREALRIRTNTLSESDFLVGVAMVQLASALAKRSGANDLVEAEGLVSKALARYGTLGGDERTNIVGWVALHAGVLNRLRKFPEAESASRRALAMRRELLGPENHDVASSLDNLALVLRDSGKLDEAEQTVREALAIQRKVLGNVSVDTATSLQYLGGILERQKRSPEAEAAYREALDARRKLDSTDNVYTATLVADLARSLRSQRKHAEATALFQDELALRRKTYGATNHAVELALGNVARSLESEGKLPEAEAAFRDALKVRRNIEGAGSTNTATLVSDVVKILKSQGKHAEVISFYRDELALRRTVYGETNRLVVIALADLARALESQTNLSAAEATFREALDLRRKIDGPAGTNTTWLLADLARTLTSQGKQAAVTPLYREDLAMRRKVGSETNSAIVTVIEKLAAALEAEGKLTEAEAAWREGLAAERVVFGNEHSSVANVLQDLARVLMRAGRPQEAEVLSREALAVRRKLIGKESPQYLATALISLNYALRLQGKNAEAFVLLEEAINHSRTADGKGWAYTNSSLGVLLHHYAQALWENKEFNKARPFAEESWALCLQHPKWGAQERTHTFQVLNAVLTSLNDQSALGSLQRDELANLRKKLPAAHPDIGETLYAVGKTLQSQGKHGEAVALFREELDRARAADGKGWASTNIGLAAILDYLADALLTQKAFTEARPPAEEAWALFEQYPDWDEEGRTYAYQVVNAVLRSLNDEPALESLHRNELDRLRKKLPADDPKLVVTIVVLGQTLLKQGKQAEAIALLRKEVDPARAADGKGWVATNAGLGFLLHHFAELLANEKAFTEARPFAEEAWALYLQHPEWSSNELSHAYIVLHDVLAGLNDHPALESLQRNELARVRQKLPLDELRVAEVMALANIVRLAQKKFVEAEEPARECLAIREKATPDTWNTFNARSQLGGSLLGQKKYAEAEPLLLSGYEGMKEREKNFSAAARPRIRETIQRLAELYEATGQLEKAAEWKKLMQAEAEK